MTYIFAEFLHEPLLMALEVIQNNPHAGQYRGGKAAAKHEVDGGVGRTPGCC
jgi:hypothetical protein